MFTDVTTGSNPYQKCAGFQASVGWDPVTGMTSHTQPISENLQDRRALSLTTSSAGLGTPIYPKMLEAAFIGV